MVVEKKVDKKKMELKIHGGTETTKGVFSNVALITHSESEFIIDFLFSIGNDHQLVSRVILTPKHMYDFHRAIGNNLKRYEKEYPKNKNNKKKSN